MREEHLKLFADQPGATPRPPFGCRGRHVTCRDLSQRFAAEEWGGKIHLRVLSRFCHREGITSRDLSGAVATLQVYATLRPGKCLAGVGAYEHGGRRL
jgi:hypothetical protein